MKKVSYLIAILLLSGNSFAQGHFVVAYDGNGQDFMNIFVVSATINGVDMEANDEIAAFDNTVCCAKSILSQKIVFSDKNTFVNLPASRKDEGLSNGYTVGHNIIFKVWDSDKKKELTGVTAEFINPVNGQTIAAPTYSPGETAFVKLTVTDAVNKAPESKAGADQSVNENDNVTLDGSASSDPDGDPITYLWTVPAGITLNSATVAKPTFTAPEVNTDTEYTFSLIVNDGKVNSTADLVVIKVKQVNKVPIANAGQDKSVNEGILVTLNASVSSDPDGDPITYLWTAPAGITLSSATVAKPTFTAPDLNVNTNYSFSLIVNDGNSNSLPDQVVITVKPANTDPFANAGADQTLNEGVLVILDASASSDPDGDPITYLWTAPAGITLSSATVAKPTFTAPEVNADKEYTFSLVVNDGTVKSIADQVVIKVKQVNKVPVANAGIDQTLDENSLCTLDGSGSADADGNTLTYLWTAPAGITLNSTNSKNPTFTVPEIKRDTVFIFSLVISDGITNSVPSTVKVFVKNVIKTTSEIVDAEEIKVYPNPSNGIFSIYGLKTNNRNKIEIYTNDGKLVSQIKSSSTPEKIDISFLNPGTYLLLIDRNPFKIIKL